MNIKAPIYTELAFPHPVLWIGLLIVLCLVASVQALPTTGAAFDISSNNFTSHVTGASGDAYIIWGQASGNNNWRSGNFTTSGGVADVVVFGAPLIGGRTVYFKACDETGCGNELTAAIPDVTPAPVPTYGDPMRRILWSHFGFQNITSEIPAALTATGSPARLFFGIIYIALLIGLWVRTRTVRMSLMIMLLTAPFFISDTVGLYLGIPYNLALVMTWLAGAMLAGIVYMFVKK